MRRQLAQSVKCLTVDFVSGPDLKVMRSSRALDTALGMKPI